MFCQTEFYTGCIHFWNTSKIGNTSRLLNTILTVLIRIGSSRCIFSLPRTKSWKNETASDSFLPFEIYITPKPSQMRWLIENLNWTTEIEFAQNQRIGFPANIVFILLETANPFNFCENANNKLHLHQVCKEILPPYHKPFSKLSIKELCQFKIIWWLAIILVFLCLNGPMYMPQKSVSKFTYTINAKIKENPFR